MLDIFLAAILRAFSWLAFAEFERRIVFAPGKIEHRSGHLCAYSVRALEYLADNQQDPHRSPLELTENGKPIGHAHSVHSEIIANGCGQYSHYGTYFLFSSSDNSDPRTNGRIYAASRTATFSSFAAWLFNRLAGMQRGADLKRRADKASFAAWIKLKWLHDRRHLPLTPEHWELYDIIHRFCWRELGEFPNLINCRDFNDRMQWLKLFDQSKDIVRCSNKLLVRDYVRGRIGDKYLVKLYQAHDHFSEIDFNALPNKFVIKANNDSGTVILVRDKSKLDHHDAAARIEAALKSHYGWRNGEWAYSFIEPKVLVEELLEADGESPPPDYKFHCSEGTVKTCRFTSGRGSSAKKEQNVDAEGNDLAIQVNPHFKVGSDFKKPALWSEMLQVAQELSRGHKFVRIDLFCTNDRVYAGEMTFWPGAGTYDSLGQRELGKYLDFDRSTYKPLLSNSVASPVQDS